MFYIDVSKTHSHTCVSVNYTDTHTHSNIEQWECVLKTALVNINCFFMG